MRDAMNGSAAELDRRGGIQGVIASHSTLAIATTMIAAHSTGVTFFELPLRGESLAA
jgi:hypothetical protein